MQRLISICCALPILFFKDMNYFYMTLLLFGSRLSDLQVFNAGIYGLVNR